MDVEKTLKWVGAVVAVGGLASLARCSVDLAHACRRSLAESWNVPDWRY